MKLADQLRKNKEDLMALFDLSEENLSRSYAPDKWTVQQLLHHITDAETVLYERIRRAISKPGQVVWGFDQDAWATELRYNEMPLSLNKPVFAAVRNNIIYLVDQYYESHGDNPYVHSETGSRKLYEEFEKVLWHAEHHMKQINQALKTMKHGNL